MKYKLLIFLFLSLQVSAQIHTGGSVNVKVGHPGSVHLVTPQPVTYTDVFDGVFQNSVTITTGQRSPFSEYVFDYTGDSLEIKSVATLTTSPFNQITVLVDSAYYDTIRSTASDIYRAMSFPSGTKRIKIVDGATSKPSSNVLGTWLTGLKVDASKYTKVGYNVDTQFVFIVNSIGVGDRTSVMATEAWTRLFVSENYKNVAVYGWGYNSVGTMAGNKASYDSTANRVDRLLGAASVQKVIISLGVNDYPTDKNDFATYYSNLINAIHTTSPTAVIYCISPIVKNGVDLQSYRDKIDSICISKDSYALHINGLNILSYPDDYNDATHPDKDGQKKLKDYVYPIINHKFDTDAVNLINRMDYDLSANQMIGIDSMFVALKDSGIYAKTDLIYVMNVADSSDAGLHWKSGSYNLTPVGGIDFTTKQGFISNGTTGYLKTGWIPSVDASQYALTSAHASVYSNTNSATGAKWEFGSISAAAARIGLGLDNNSLTYFNLNAALSTNSGITNTIGLFTITRTKVGVVDSMNLYQNSTKIVAPNGSPSAVPSKELYILGMNNNGTLLDPSPRQLSFFSIGSYITATETRKLSNILIWWNAKVTSMF